MPSILHKFKNFKIISYIFILYFPFYSLGVDSDSYYRENPSLERKAILEFITQQFKGKKVSQRQLDSLWLDKDLRQKLRLARFQIINQKLYVESFDITRLYFVSLVEYFQKLSKNYKISNVDFIIHIWDEIYDNGEIEYIYNFPSFMMSKDLNSKAEQQKFLIPDAYIIKKNWNDLITRIKQANLQYSWEEKEEKIFWRGNASGGPKGPYKISNFAKIPRLKLIFFSKLYPFIVDARLKYSHKNIYEKDEKDLIEILDLVFSNEFSKIKEEEHLKYKYLISIDGNTCAWMRVPWIMLSNSVLLKQESSKIQWFYVALKPYYNYIPIKEDLSDLFEHYEWLKQHNQEAKEISINAQNFITNNLMPEDIDKQMVITLNEYAKIQENEPLPSLSSAEEVFSFRAIAENLVLRLYNKIKLFFKYSYF